MLASLDWEFGKSRRLTCVIVALFAAVAGNFRIEVEVKVPVQKILRYRDRQVNGDASF